MNTSNESGVTVKSLALLLMGLALAVFWIATGQADENTLFPMPADKLYVEECGACHTAYAPGFLPARSWVRMMRELDSHFGDDASLDEPQRLAIQRQLTDLAADSRNGTLLMRRIAGSIPANAAPQRITEGWFFKFMHDEVPASFWQRKKVGSKANCIACHPRANEGSYPEREVRIPPQ